MCKSDKRKQPVNGAIYGMGLIGAAVYYIGSSVSFWGGVLGFLKALVWPAFLVYDAFKYMEIPMVTG